MGVSYREQNNKAAAVRRGIVEPRPVSKRSKIKPPRTIVVEMRFLRPGRVFPRGWSKHGAYSSLGVAQQVVDQGNRKYAGGIEYRIRPDT